MGKTLPFKKSVLCFLVLSLFYFSSSGQLTLYSYKDSTGKYGFKDIQGRIIVRAKYDDVYEFREGYAFVELNSKYGFIDKTGKEITQIKYQNAGMFNEGFAFVQLNG
ncbi:MAG TPA: WG repeat-containing protein, partial [Chitinophagaceae bacterium]|nr:WG repeat-containing protein [Chitinophagaceae bacterium]